MTHRVPLFRSVRISGAIAAGSMALILSLAAPDSARADIQRTCRGELTIYVEGAGNDVEHQLRSHVRVRNRAYANRARRQSRENIYTCMRNHWAVRMRDERPSPCERVTGYGYIGFHEEMTDELCAANPGRQSFLVGVRVAVTGNTGCTVNNDWAGITLAQNHRVYCRIDRDEPLH